MLLGVNTAIEPSNVQGDKSKYLLFDACRLASKENQGEEKKIHSHTLTQRERKLLIIY